MAGIVPVVALTALVALAKALVIVLARSWRCYPWAAPTTADTAALAGAAVAGAAPARADTASQAAAPPLPPGPPPPEFSPLDESSRRTWCNADYVVQRGEAAWSFFMNNGFVVVDLGLDDAGKAAFANLASHMGVQATDPAIRHNRGPGRTCVNSYLNVQNAVWQEALKYILRSREVKLVLEELVTLLGVRFHDCGGDVVEADTPDEDPPEVRNPCRWHRDHQWYLQWFCISVLCSDTAINQGPLVLESWGGRKDHFWFAGHCGLAIIRDVYGLHRGSRNTTPLPRQMPSFRFGHGNVATPCSMSVEQLQQFIGA